MIIKLIKCRAIIYQIISILSVSIHLLISSVVRYDLSNTQLLRAPYSLSEFAFGIKIFLTEDMIVITQLIKFVADTNLSFRKEIFFFLQVA